MLAGRASVAEAEGRPPRSPTRAPARALGPALSGLARHRRPSCARPSRRSTQYLADRVPPLMAADSVAVLVEAPVEGAAAEILGLGGAPAEALKPDLPLVDLLFHALHKLSVMGEFQLVEETSAAAPSCARWARSWPRPARRPSATGCAARSPTSASPRWSAPARGDASAALRSRSRPRPALPAATTPGLRRLSHPRAAAAARGRGRGRGRPTRRGAASSPRP